MSVEKSEVYSGLHLGGVGGEFVRQLAESASVAVDDCSFTRTLGRTFGVDQTDRRVPRTILLRPYSTTRIQ